MKKEKIKENVRERKLEETISSKMKELPMKERVRIEKEEEAQRRTYWKQRKVFGNLEVKKRNMRKKQKKFNK